MKTNRLLPALAALGGVCLPLNLAFAQEWMPTAAPTGYWSALASSSDGTKLVATGNLYPFAPIHVSTNSGANWWAVTNVVSSTNWHVACSADGTRMVASAGGGIYGSTNSGVTWTKTPAPPYGWTALLCSADGGRLTALAASSFACFCPGIFTSTNWGVTWISNSVPFGIDAFGAPIASSADGTKLAAPSFGRINLSTNSGATWTDASMPDGSWSSIASSANGSILVAAGYRYAPCSCPVIYTSQDSGASWVSTSLPNQSYATHVAASADGSNLVAVGSFPGTIYTSSDSGATWVSNSAPSQSWQAVASSADGSKLIAAAGGGGIYGFSSTAPVIYNPPASQTVVAGTSVMLAVGASGAVPVTYQWALNDARLLNETNATLALPNVPITASGGRYSVRVTNSIGSVVSADALLTVVPAFISTEPVTGVSPTGAVFNGFVTPGASLTTAWFQWGTNSSYGNGTVPIIPGTGFNSLSFTNSITGLIPATVYQYRAVASNELGTVTGVNVIFSTPGFPFNLSGAPVNPWLSVASSADGAKLVAASTSNGGVSGRVYTSTNSGATWEPTGAPATGWSIVASSADGTRLAALEGGIDLECWGAGGGAQGPIYMSTNSGATWAPSSSPLTNWTGAAASADGMKWVAVGRDWSRNLPGLIHASTNGGITWLPTGAPSDHWSAIASSADGIRLVATSKHFNDGAIYVSHDAGANWTKPSVPSTPWTSVATSSDGMKLVAVSAGGLIFTSTDGGGIWTRSEAALAMCWRCVTSSADGSKLAAATAFGNIFTSTDSGTNWVSRPSGNIYNFTSMASSADGHKFVVSAFGGGIYTLQSTPAPRLTIKHSGSSLGLSWIVPSAGFALQENADLTTTNWTDVTGTPTVNLTNLQNQVTVPLPAGHRFYRLRN